MGRGGGQMVSVLAFCSYNPSSNLADTYSFSVKFVFEKNENKQIEVEKNKAWVNIWSSKSADSCKCEPFKDNLRVDSSIFTWIT